MTMNKGRRKFYLGENPIAKPLVEKVFHRNCGGEVMDLEEDNEPGEEVIFNRCRRCEKEQIPNKDLY